MSKNNKRESIRKDYIYIDTAIQTPRSNEYTELLRFVIQIMDADDLSFEFTASLLSFSVNNSGLSDKQAKWADKIIDKYFDLYGIVYDEEYETYVHESFYCEKDDCEEEVVNKRLKH